MYTLTDLLETFEVGSPWITYRYLTTDRQTRITGRSKILGECAICGVDELFVLRIPRVGPVPVPEGGRHPERVRFVRAHQHTAEERTDRLKWSKPLRNVAGMSMDQVAEILAARLSAEFGESGLVEENTDD